MPSGIIPGIFLFLGIGLLIMVRADQAKAALANYPVINEMQVDGKAGTGGTDDDFLELFNPTGQEVDLTDWSIQKTSASGATTSLFKLTLSGKIPAGGYFLIVRDNVDTSQALKDLADLKSSSFSIASNNIVFLVNNDDKIIDASDQDIIDFVGFGSVSYFEGAAGPSIPEAKSISRIPDGEDNNNNFTDFQVLNTPSPKNSQAENNGLGGTVLLTITMDNEPVQDITANSANVVFQVNDDGQAKVNYGLENSYGNATIPETVLKNATKIISLTGLECGKTYHYSVFAENTTETDQLADALFSTLPCGIAVNTLVMTKTAARANNQYTDGWSWEYDITVWNMNETSLKMKFGPWSGAGILDAAANMQYSVDNGTVWHDITANSAYPSAGANLSGIDNSASAGRQVKIKVRMKVPVGTGIGYYNSNYGILTE